MIPPPFIHNIRFAIREATAFVGHSFSDDDKEIVEQIIRFLTKLGVKCETGARPEPRTVSDKVLDRINAAELFVGIFTRRDSKENGTFSTSAWVIEEKATALAAGKRLLLFVEDGVSEFGGLQGDYEYVCFDRKDFGTALVQAMDYVLAVTTAPFELQIEGNNKINVKIGSGQTPEQQLDAIQQRIKRNPHDAQARLTLLQLYRIRQQHSEALAESRKLSAEFPHVSQIQHEDGHAKENVGDLQGALLSYQRALGLAPGDYKNHRCYGRCLYQYARTLQGTMQASTLNKARRLLQRAALIGGDQKHHEIDGDLFLVDEALGELGNTD